jgi:hypothetical protein
VARYVPAVAAFLCDKAVVLGTAMKDGRWMFVFDWQGAWQKR